MFLSFWLSLISDSFFCASFSATTSTTSTTQFSEADLLKLPASPSWWSSPSSWLPLECLQRGMSKILAKKFKKPRIFTSTTDWRHSAVPLGWFADCADYSLDPTKSGTSSVHSSACPACARIPWADPPPTGGRPAANWPRTRLSSWPGPLAPAALAGSSAECLAPSPAAFCVAAWAAGRCSPPSSHPQKLCSKNVPKMFV